MHNEDMKAEIVFCDLFDKNVVIEVTTRSYYGGGIFPVEDRYIKKCLSAEKKAECLDCPNDK